MACQKDIVFDFLDSLTDKNINQIDKGTNIDGFEHIPDEILQIHKFNKKKLSYKLQINNFAY